jgi:hypothetical protein
MSPTFLGRFMFALGYLILFSLFSFEAMSRELAVFAIQKNLQMSNKDPVYHDFYLDGGSETGLKVGQVVSVVRRIPLHDLTRNRPLGDMHLPVGQMKIIYVQRGSSVARIHKMYQDKDRPVVEFNTVMVGDQINSGPIGDEEEEAEEAAPAPLPKKEAPKPAEKTTEKPAEKSTEKAEMSSQGADTPVPVQPKPTEVINAPKS